MNPNHQDAAIMRRHILQQKYLKNLASSLVLLLVLGSIYLIDQRPEVVSLEKALLAVGIIWVSMYPSLQYLFDQNRPPMPFMPLVGIFYATSFGLPIFAGEIKVTGRFSLKEVDSTALILVLTSLIGMNLAFYYSKSNIWRRISPLSLPRKYSLKTLLTLLWTFLLLHVAFLYIPFIKTIPSAGQFLEPIGYIAYGMFFILWKRGLLSSISTLMMIWIFMPLEIIPRLASGLLSEAMILGLFMVVVVFAETKRLPIILILISLMTFSLFNPVKSEFRRLTWTDKPLNSLERIQVFADLVYKHYTAPRISNDRTSKGSENDAVVSRSAHIIVFSTVVKDTPSKVPYWQGESYAPLFTSFIPRVIWPDKPFENTGNVFGRRYRYLDSDDFSTSFNLPWIVEMYANFGETGVILGMSLVGVFLAFLEQKLNRLDMQQPLEIVTSIAILFRLIYQESNFSLMVGGLILLSISLFFTYKLFLRPGIGQGL
jgi:O-antigen polysaccharide polymerase Wzy